MTGASIRRLASLFVVRFPPSFPEGIWLKTQSNPSVKTSPSTVRLLRLFRSSTFTGMLRLKWERFLSSELKAYNHWYNSVKKASLPSWWMWRKVWYCSVFLREMLFWIKRCWISKYSLLNLTLPLTYIGVRLDEGCPIKIVSQCWKLPARAILVPAHHYSCNRPFTTVGGPRSFISALP